MLGVPGAAIADPLDALDAAREAAGPEGGVVVAGSLYVVGEVRGSFGISDDRSLEAHLRYEALVDPDDDDDVFEAGQASPLG